eukprot:344465-Chlamydomonas_euryale.AAC.1
MAQLSFQISSNPELHHPCPKPLISQPTAVAAHQGQLQRNDSLVLGPETAASGDSMLHVPAALSTAGSQFSLPRLQGGEKAGSGKARSGSGGGAVSEDVGNARSTLTPLPPIAGGRAKRTSADGSL